MAKLKARVVSDWGFFYAYVYRVKFKNDTATKIQRQYRAHIRVKWEHRSATIIARVYRGHQARVLRALLQYRRFELMSRVAQRAWRIHSARLWRRREAALQHSAAYAIQRCAKAFLLRLYLWRTRMQAINARLALAADTKEQV